MAGDEEGSTTQGASVCGAGGGGAQLATGGVDPVGAGAWGGLRGSFPLAWGVPELPSRHGGAREPETPTNSGWASREQRPTLPLPLRSRNGGIRLCCALAGAAGGDASPVANWFYWAAEGRFHRVLAAGRPSHPLPPPVFVPFRRRWEPLGGPGELAGGRRWSPFPQPEPGSGSVPSVAVRGPRCSQKRPPDIHTSRGGFTGAGCCHLAGCGGSAPERSLWQSRVPAWSLAPAPLAGPCGGLLSPGHLPGWPQPSLGAVSSTHAAWLPCHPLCHAGTTFPGTTSWGASAGGVLLRGMGTSAAVRCPHPFLFPSPFRGW